MKLEYLKVIIRSTIGKYTGIKRSELEDELTTLEESLNDVEALKQKVLRNKPNMMVDSEKSEFEIRFGKVEIARKTLANEINLTRTKIEDIKSFKATVNWYEYGEKSNKFFLNLNKFKSKQKLIASMKNGDKQYIGQPEVMGGITNFYRDLYSNKLLPESQDPNFFKLCPTLSEVNKNKLDDEIGLEEMLRAIKTCNETAPGPDGIPYKVYKVFWKEIGHILKESWDYSIKIGELPKSHKESAIIIIPKEGKDIEDIKNWRPITLSNCDAKIITKTLALRLNPILDTIIDTSQTAYVPGRSVMDNLRSNKFLKDYCNKNQINAILTSLDAKKAFDSVDHGYIDEVLEKYGFGKSFRLYFKTIYKDISARIIINGHFSESIKIERGVKQGDALSCAIFILCIDPLLRNLNNNREIKPITISNIHNSKKTIISHKASGFADDISVVCMDDSASLSQIFLEYQRLTNKSGLTLNADKTEIICLNPNIVGKQFIVSYENNHITIPSVSKLKICGLYFCKDTNEEYYLNVISKIDKLINKLKIWKSRHLTFEGKSLVLKTFGISQLIYNMQCVIFEKSQLVEIERYIFNFIWGTKEIENPRARDRIKRSTMKSDYEKGGLKITDIESLDRSLKLRQYIRAAYSNHNIKQIQRLCTNNGKSNEVLLQEFSTISTEEDICRIAQESINYITDACRKDFFSEKGEIITSKFAIEQIAMTDIKTYLTRKSRVFLKCIFKPFEKKGIESFFELVREAETELDNNISKRLENVIKAFPPYFRDSANSFNDDTNIQSKELTHLLNTDGRWLPIRDVTTKELQWIFKKILNKIPETNIRNKLGIDNDDEIRITNFRDGCKNPRLRHIHFRLIHDDFFTRSKMYKFKMIDNPNCQRCGLEETTKHLLWDCRESQKIWVFLNEILTENSHYSSRINKYSDIYRTESNNVVSIIKMKIIQEMIQIERPINWNKEKIIQIILRMRDLEIPSTIGKSRNINIIHKWNNFIKPENISLSETPTN